MERSLSRRVSTEKGRSALGFLLGFGETNNWAECLSESDPKQQELFLKLKCKNVTANSNS